MCSANRKTAAGQSFTIDDTFPQGGNKAYIPDTLWTQPKTMVARLYTATLFALYQFTLLLGILLLPVAMITERLGLRLPMDRVLSGLNDAYAQASA